MHDNAREESMSLVTNYLQKDYPDRIQEFSDDVCSVQTPAERIAAWRKEGAFTVFMAGTFDIPTPNHRLGLTEARLMGAAGLRKVAYPPDETRLEVVTRAAATDMVRLLVTLDTDEGARSSKGFHPSKGNCPRPIFSWPTRAMNVASYSVPRPDGAQHRMVDFITRHGPNACLACPECSAIDNAKMVANLQPDLVVINAASTATLDTVVAAKERGELPDTRIGITND